MPRRARKPIQGRKALPTGDDMAYTITKRVCTIGAGMGVYLEKDLGFRPGDMVEITICRAGSAEKSKEVEDGNS